MRGAGALFGTEARVEWGRPPPDDGFPAAGVTFELLFELSRHPMSPVAPVLPPPDDNIPSPTVFDVFFEVELPDVGAAQHTAHFEVTPGQPLRFATVNVGAPQGPAFPLSFDLLATGSVDPGEPLFTMNLFGAFSEEQAVPTLAPRMLGLLAVLLIAAALAALRKRAQLGAWLGV